MSDLRADLEALREQFAAQPMRAQAPLMSPRCGLHGEHAPACRSAICECACHLTPLPMIEEDWADTES